MTSRAVDAWGALRARVTESPSVIANVAIAATYALLFAVVRDASNDQWYLPAGLRFASLLAVPFRFWPALYLGDIAGLAIARYPVIDRHGWIWYAGMLFPAWPPTAIVVQQLRARTNLPIIRGPIDAAALSVAIVLAAELTSIASKAASAVLGPGTQPIRYGDLLVYSLGDIQGILLGSFAVAVVANGGLKAARSKTFRTEVGCALVLTAGMAAAVSLTKLSQPAALDGARLLLFVPAITLSLRHGWRGACIGAIGGDVALLWTMPHQDKGMSDSAALTMQEVFAFLSLALFVLGARASNSSQARVAISADLPDCDGREAQRARFNSVEEQLREKALRAEAMQANARGNIAPVVAILRKSGHAEAAMNLIGATHVESTQFRHTVIDGIYPLTVERDGLYAALNSQGFLERFGAAKCELDLTGNAHKLALETLLSAYRIVGEAADYLLASSPSCIRIAMRCSERNGLGHLSMRLVAYKPATTGRTSVETARLAGLRTRAIAFNGSFHNRPHRLRIILVDAHPGTTQQRTTTRRHDVSSTASP